MYSKGTGGGQQGWIYLLAPTPELWTMVLRHRTQILYAADIAMICMFLELRPGCTGRPSVHFSVIAKLLPSSIVTCTLAALSDTMSGHMHLAPAND